MSKTSFAIAGTSLHPFGGLSKSKQDYLRYVIWLALAGTAYANRRHFRLVTTWAPHLLGNSITLLLPEIYRIADDLFNFGDRLTEEDHPTGSALREAFQELVLDNPDYVEYVAPAALAYCVSHPRFNIYRGKWAELNLCGFGLDSIPHSTTAYALTRLLRDTFEVLDENLEANAPLRVYVSWAAQNNPLATGIVIAFLTLIYEIGEYVIHQSELRARDYDETRINMMWNLTDSVFDGLSNAIGWAAATLQRSR